MNVPRHSDKYSAPSILTASDVLRQRSPNHVRPRASSPETVILCYPRDLMQQMIKHYRTQKIAGFYGDLFALQVAHGQVAVYGNFGLGAPLTAIAIEELTALGAQRFIAVGIAGGLQSQLKPGDVVVCDRALRDEGTSQHYLPPASFSEANGNLITTVTRAFDRAGLAFSIGRSWTIDAPYRETRVEVERFQRDGVLTVEMEAAALYAVADYLKVQAVAVFVVSDSLAERRWQPAPDGRVVQLRLQRVLKALLQNYTEPT